MKRLQFSMLSLLAAVTFTSLGCAALVNASPRWAVAIVSLSFFMLLIATLGAAYLKSRARTWCGGFAIFGWGYFLLLTSLFDVEQYLFTGAANDRVYALLNDAPTQQVYSSPQPMYAFTGVPSPGATYASAPTVTGYPTGMVFTTTAPSGMDYGAFDRIGHSLWAILAGVLGAVLASCFANRAKEPARSSDETHAY